MGGRSGRAAHELIGSGPSAARSKKDIQRKLKDGSPKIAAETVLKAAATQNPAVTVLYCAYEAAKFTYPIVKKGIDTYEKTGDKDRAVDKMKAETVKQVGKKIKETAVETIVSAAWNGAKNSSGVQTDTITDTIVTSAVSGVINEVIQ